MPGAPFLLITLDALRITDAFIIRKCIVQCVSAAFTFKNIVLNGVMLDKAGIIEDSPDSTTTNVCADCFTALSKENCVPRFVLTNNLYCGELPKYFEDLTWVEEKICAIYSTTAHVTRLFQSLDPLQPKVFHSNICAHDMN